MNTIVCVYLFLSVFYAVHHSDDFVLLTALRPAGTHLPGPSDAVDTITEFTCTQQRTVPWYMLSTCKCAIPVMYYTYNVLERLDNFCPYKPVSFLNELHYVIVSSDALIGTAGYPVLQARCCLSR